MMEILQLPPKIIHVIRFTRTTTTTNSTTITTTTTTTTTTSNNNIYYYYNDNQDLKYRSKEEIRKKYPIVFSQLPKNEKDEPSFDSKYKNPCWIYDLPENPNHPWGGGMQGMENKGIIIIIIIIYY